MGWAEILTFAFVVTLLVISPGPNGILIAKTVPTSGRTAGFANIGGFVTAFYLHGALSILGLSVILLHSATAFTVIKYLGAAYLLWVGINSLRAAFKAENSELKAEPAKKKRTLVKAYLEGLLTNALNPKVSMFYLAAFPQFIPVGGNTFASAALLLFIHAAINVAWFGVIVLLLNKVSGVAQSGKVQRWLKGITGIALIGFGVKLASYDRG